jgi:hypothetical protein
MQSKLFKSHVRGHYLIVTAIINLLSIVCMAGFAQAGEAEVIRFQNEFPEASRSLEKRFQQVRGRLQYSEQVEPFKNQFRTTEVDFAIDHENRKSVTFWPRTIDQQKREDVLCVNIRNTFQLERKGDAADYLLKVIKKGKNSSISFDGGYGRFLKSPYCLVGRSMANIVKSNNYKIISAKTCNIDNKELVEVEMEFGGPPRYPAKILFDPSIGWAIRKSEVVLTDFNKVKIVTNIDYKDGFGGLPIPTEINCIDIDSKQKKCHFLSCVFEPTANSEFEPAFFGLPDLDSSDSSNARQSYAPWLASLAVVGLVISFVIRKMATRTK